MFDAVRVTDPELKAKCMALVHTTPDFEALDCSGEMWAVTDPRDGTILATAGAVLEADTRDVRLTFCVVREGHKGNGLQAKLIRVRTFWARRKGALSLQTYAYKENVASLISLLKCGFQIVDYDGEFLTLAYPL
jgi:GNAT superfamily N-acetyltransferase